MLRYNIVALSAVFVAVLAGSRPVVAQSSGVLASAERAVTEALAEQEAQAGSVIRRPRSPGMAKVGAVVLAAGSVVVFSQEIVGLAALATGGVLIWRGLGMVEVPLRVDLTTGRGFRAYRSFSW